MRHEGGTLEIPSGWRVVHADFDAAEPYIAIARKGAKKATRKLLVPKSLAYFLSNEFCGSRKMMQSIKREHELVLEIIRRLF